MRKIVIALGGNALLQRSEEPTYANQHKNIKRTASVIAKHIKNCELVITHGNGPQVGDELIRNRYASSRVPPLPLYLLNAETQALIGSIFEIALQEELGQRGIEKEIVTVITHVVVDRNDRAFKTLKKQIGPFYNKRELQSELRKNRFMYVKTGGLFRRVVPSPRPKEVLEMESIKKLVKAGRYVISGGGGGIPLYRHGRNLVGVDAVIDKDLTTQLIASAINADTLIILTNVDCVYEKLSDKRSGIKNIKASELKKELKKFEEGTMKPKIDACIRFIEKGGNKAYIGNLFKFGDILKGRSGTEIY